MKTTKLLFAAIVWLATALTGWSDTFYHFATRGFTVNEQDGSAIISIVRTGDTNEYTDVFLYTSDGTAVVNRDYLYVDGYVGFEPGVTNATFTIPILNDALHESNETVAVTMIDDPHGLWTNAVLTIVDNDPGVEFSAATYSVNERDGFATITVRRQGDFTGAFTVDYGTSDGTAGAAADYVAQNGTLSFAAGDTNRTITIAIVDDARPEGDEYFWLHLNNATGGVPLGAVTTAAITIHEGLALSIRTNGSQVQLDWPARFTPPGGAAPVFPLYEVQRSRDLTSWQAVTAKLRGGANTNLSVAFNRDQQAAFYRLLAEWTNSLTGDGGAEVFGYGKAFAEELARLGQITAQQFAAGYGVTNTYLSAFPLDPTQAQYWDLFAEDPLLHNFCAIPGIDSLRNYDWRLNRQELAVLRTNGFVVSERLGTPSFGEAYYRIWWDDLPVFISTDSILQAWHRSYDNMLTEVEETWLFNSVDQMLTGMAGQIENAYSEAEFTTLHDSVLDADYFVAVARSLLAGNRTNTSLPQSDLPQSGTGGRVAATLQAINREQLEWIELFGSLRQEDFSQFKPRGHYEDSERLRRYFKTLMWLGRIDMRITSPDPNPYTVRQLGTAMVLLRALQLSGQYENWQRMDRVLQTFVGYTDSMTFAQLADLVAAGGVTNLSSAQGEASVERLQERIFQGELGVQNIRGDVFSSPLGAAQLRLPRSFTVMGQKFVVDSWAFSQTVYDRVLWNGGKVCRRMPSALDVAFSVLHNDQAVPELLPEMNGVPYQQSLAAVRNVIDSQTPESWEANLYMNWLSSLRELSPPTTDPAYPDALRTRAWAMKTLNTQLGSWATLRHDTILYAKQSYTAGEGCSYPDAYVEPRVEFWQRLGRMASSAAALIEATPYADSIAVVKTNQAGFFRHFAEVMSTLQSISEKELARAPLSDEEQVFLRQVVQRVDRWSAGYLGPTDVAYDGWYNHLFYRPVNAPFPFHVAYGASKWDAIVADVHTDVPSEDIGCPSDGGILHEGTGSAHMMLVVVNDGLQSKIFAGPVFSHYEFVAPFPQRETDLGWQADFRSGNVPPHPEWTRSFLVSGTPGAPAVRGTHAIAGGMAHGMALTTDGKLWTWGANDSGEFGNGTTESSVVPIQTATNARWASISVERRTDGSGRTLGLAQNGTIWTWGNGITQPTNLSWESDWHALAAAGGACAALKTDGSLWVLDPSPRRIGLSNDWVNITAGGSHFLAIRHDRSLWAWGDNAFGQLGDGTVEQRAAPVQIGTNTGWLGIVAGGDGGDPSEPSHSVSVKLDGTLWTWGGNRYGQLGDGTTLDRVEPVQVTPATNWDRIAVGCQHTLALKKDGTLWSWGRNDSGQLGDGTTEQRNVPVQIGAAHDWAAIAAGYGFTLALKADGSLWAWGANDGGQLGDGTTTPRLIPTRIGSSTEWGLPE